MLNTNCEWKIEFGSNSNPAQNSGAVDFQRIAGISFSSSCCVTRYVSYSSQLWLRFFFFFNSSELCYGIAESSLRWLRGEVVTREGSEVSFSEMNCEEWALIFEQKATDSEYEGRELESEEWRLKVRNEKTRKASDCTVIYMVFSTKSGNGSGRLVMLGQVVRIFVKTLLVAS